MTVADQTVLVISGTADSGQAIVESVAAAGGTVGFTYQSDSDTAETLLDEIPGDHHRSWQCDVTDVEQTTTVVDDAFQTFDEIDSLIFTVGVISPGRVGDIHPETWNDHIDANLTGAYHTIQAATPYFKDQGFGAIVALSASPGVIRDDELGAYDASKRGLEAFIQETARELGSYGVRANVVAPGFIRDPDSISHDHRQELLDQLPYKRVTRPQDIADVALYLASDRAATVTGVVLPADSGLAL